MVFPDDIDLRLGAEYTEYGYGIFPSGSPIHVTPPTPQCHLTLPYDPTPQPCPPDQEFIPPFGCLYPCTMEQLTRDGYRPPEITYPRYPEDHNPEIRTQEEPGRTDKRNITILCREPPLLPPPEKLTIVEVRPRAPPTPPPIHIYGSRPPPPRTPPPLIFRERPPPKPPVPDKETCYVKLNRPPAPPPQQIRHEYYPAPSKPPHIIIERWLPYKRQLPDPHAKEIIHPPPYNPKPLRHVIIRHIHPQARIDHKIDKDPRPPILTDPGTYAQEYGHTFIDKEELLRRVEAKLRDQHVSEDNLRRLRAIFRVQCNETHEPISPNSFQSNIFNYHTM